MPELPDVATMQQYVRDKVLNQTISRVKVHEADLLKNITVRKFVSGLQDRKFRSVQRRGKYLIISLDDGKYLVIHFGMTGFLKYGKSKEQMPEHTRVVFEFSGGHYLAYDSQRKLGLLTLIDKLEPFVEEKELGPDALGDVSWDMFKQRLAGRRGTIKSALMNQSLIAGIGNIYGDEILFQAGVDPRKPVPKLNENTLKRIYKDMRRVLQTAAKRQAKVDKLPRSYLLPHRESDRKCPRCSSEIKEAKIAGRTSCYCARCQT